MLASFKRKDFMIRPAKLTDIDAICAIAQSVALKPKNVATDGFLISAYSRDMYGAMVKAKSGVFVTVSTEPAVNADTREIVTGFLIAYDKGFSPKSEWSESERLINQTLGDVTDYSVIKQIAVSRDHRGQGHATALYRHYFDRIEHAHVFTTIVSNPPNPASEKFHRLRGFTPFLPSQSRSVDGRENYDSRLWYAGAPGSILGEGAISPSVLAENLHQATTLYLHEDNLNWTKIQFLVTVLFALIVSAWALSGLPYWDSEIKDIRGLASTVLAALTMVSGFLILMAIDNKIKSGLKFMASHKANVRLIETKLSIEAPGFIRSVSKVPQVATTVKIMGTLPIFAYLAWTAVSVFLAIRIFAWIFS